MDATTILQALQTSLSGALLVILNKLWAAFEKQNEFVREMALQGEAERAVMAHELGYDTHHLKREAALVRERWRGFNSDHENPKPKV